MAEGSPTSTPPADVETPPETPESTDEQPDIQSVEEVEAIWKNRIAGKDRAHNAEVAALRANLAAAEARAAQKAPISGDESEPNEWQVKYEAEAKARADERTAHQAEVRAAKYPLAAEALETGVLAQMDEGKLAALNARLDSGEQPPPSRIDPSQPPKRTPDAPKPTNERGIGELESDLKRYSPEYIDRITNQ